MAGAATFGAGIGLDRLVGGSSRARAPKAPGSAAATVPFYGEHQAGIATSAQEYLYLAAFDVASDARGELVGVLRRWSEAAASLTAGEPYQPAAEEPGQPPLETGEARGLSPARLTLTFGFGPSLFGDGTRARFGLAGSRPPELAPLPPFQGESLESARSGGDLCVQACADDPQVAFHAVHVLSRIANGVAVLRWGQAGFGRTSSTSRSQVTPRNLMGFKDGTDNIKAEDGAAMNEFIWVQEADRAPAWLAGGTYLIARRIRILFDVWDGTSLEGQQRVIGRDKLTGAPLGERAEYDPVDLDAVSNGEPTIPANAHIRLANPMNNNGQRILRRGYSYNEGIEAGTGEIDAGLFFIAFQRSPERQFIPLQRRLAASDALNRHTLHTASAIFACPPGIAAGDFIGQQLFE